MNKENKQPEINEEIVETVDETVDETAEETTDTPAKKAKREKPVRSAEVIRKMRRGRIATLVTAAVVVLTLLLNVVFSALNDRFPLSLDLSSDKVFTLSEESKDLAKSLTKPVEIVVFASEDVFSNVQSSDSLQYSGGMEEISTVLTEFYNATKQYEQLTGGKVTTTYIDMNRNPTAVSQYSKYKEDEAIAQGDILFISEAQSKQSNVAEGLFTYDVSEYYSSGALNVESIVEKTLATKLKAVQSVNEQVITFATGFSEDSTALSNLQGLYELNGYSVETVDLTRSAEINANTVCMVIPAPTKDYTTEAIEKLRSWLHNDGKEGRNLMVYTDAYADCTNLYEFLQVEYGLEVTDNLVMETDMNKVYAYNPYYAYGSIADTDYAVSCTGGDVLSGYTRQIVPHWEAKTDQSTQYSVNVVTFSDKAQIIDVANVDDQQFTTTGTAYDGTIVGMAVAVKEGFQNALQVATRTTVTVCGSQYVGHDIFTSMSTTDNEALLLDATSVITGVSNTINISSKPLTAETVSFSVIEQIFVGLGLFTVLLPVAMLIVALVVFLKRRHL